jgi:hypothetical protein
VFEAHVRSLEVNEEIVRVKTRNCTRGAVRHRLVWWRLGNTVVDEMPIHVSSLNDTVLIVLPVDRRDCVAKRLLDFRSFERIDIAVDAASLLHGRDAASHPLRAADQFIVRCHDRPVQSVF